MPRRLKHQRISADFGALLRDQRLEAGLTQQELGRRSRLDVSFLSRMERGIAMPSIGTFMQLAHVLHASPVRWLRALSKPPRKKGTVGVR